MRATEFALPLEIKLAAATGELTGYGSTFGNVDLGGDMVASGAFAKSIAEHAAAGTMPAMLWSHNPDEPIGIWTEAKEDQRGLLLKGKLTLETQRGTEARALAKDGALALSIGYATRDAEFAREGHRILKDVILYEVSLVGIPMNPAARITSVKSLAADNIRDAIGFERFLKSHGFANSLARRLAAGWVSAVGRRDDDEGLTELVNALKGSASTFRKDTR